MHSLYFQSKSDPSGDKPKGSLFLYRLYKNKHTLVLLTNNQTII